MGYIRELRALIGHRPIVMPGTLAVISNPDGEVLFIRRGDTGRWSLPGGMVEPGQSARETLAREVYEETGLRFAKASPFGIYSHPRNSIVYPNGDQVQPFTVVFLVEEWEGDIRTDGVESLEIAFFPPQHLPDCHPLNRELLADLQTYLVDRQCIID